MASQTRSAGLGQSVVYGPIVWGYVTDIYTSNNQYAWLPLPRIEVAPNNRSHWLRATTFGFTIPTGSTINGIKADFERHATLGLLYDYGVKIVKAGSEQGTDKKSGVAWPATDTYKSYGGTTDKWGLSWTVAQINASNFGVSIAAENQQSATNLTYVDHVRITVYYTPPPPLPDMKVNISDTFRQASEIKINVGDSWRTVTEVKVNIGDVWRAVFG